MKNMTLVAVLACSAVWGCASWNEGSSHASPEWGRMFSDDISNKMITAFEEDGCGHIWIGTFRGLNKFNSYDYSQFFCTDEDFDIPDNHITALHCGSDGRLWVSTVNGTCRYTSQGDFQQVPIAGENKYVVQILETGRGRIFLNTFLDFYAYNPETESFETVLSGVDPDFTMNVRGHVDANDVLWVANPTSLRCYNSESMNLLDSIALTGYPMYSALLDNGELWLTGYGSVQIMDVNTHRFKTVSDAVAKGGRLSNDRINCIHPYEDGLLLNTDRQGLLYYNRREDVVFRPGEGGFPFEAPAFTVTVMFTDSHGNLWIGSDDQGYVVRSGNQKRFNSNYMLRSAFEGKSVVALQKDGKDRLWILTHSDGLWLYDGKSLSVRQIELPSRLRVNGYEPNVNYIFIDGREDLWLITEYNTVTHCSFDGVRLKIEETFSLYGARYIIQDENGVMWVSANGWYVFVKGPK